MSKKESNPIPNGIKKPASPPAPPDKKCPFTLKVRNNISIVNIKAMRTLMKDKANNGIELSNKQGIAVETVGELQELLKSFKDECKITPVHLYYIEINGGESAYLQIKKESK